MVVSSDPIRVLIAEHHDMVRQSLALMIDLLDDIEIVGEAINGVDAIRMCEEIQPDVVLLGLYLPQIDGMAAARLLAEKPKRPYMIVVDGLEGPAYEHAARQAGADDYFTHETSMDEIIAAIRASVK
jgi:two-component system, NarL family, response regulator LiaR